MIATTGLQSLEGIEYVVFGFFGLVAFFGALVAFLIARRKKLGVRLLWALGAAIAAPLGTLVLMALFNIR